VLMSASPDLYVPAIGKRLGFALTVCSGVRWDGDVLDGRLEGPNCRDEEKLRRLQALRREFPGARFLAYGNTGADLPHLFAADEGVFVNGHGHALQEARTRGLRIVRWK
jgi:phosphatidylglycerophosphatase C